MKKIFLLLGGNKLNAGILDKFKKKGYSVYVIDWNEYPQLKGDRHYRLDVKDSDAIIKKLKDDGEWTNVCFAYSSIDLAVKSVAAINREIGLQTISDDGLLYAASKSMMTKCWSEVGILNRFSKSYKEFDDSIAELNNAMKIIIKPDNSASSRGITIVEKNSSKQVILEAFDKAANEATNKTVVVEEFVVGTEYTVELLGDSYGNVCVYAISRKTHTHNTINNKIAVKLHYNSVSDELQQSLAVFGIDCYKALGFSSSLGHLEVIVKEDGQITPVEIGARSSGFIASDLVDVVSGSDYLGDLIKVQQGMKVEHGLHHQENVSSMYFFYDFPDGMCVINECSLLDFCDERIKSRYFDRNRIVKQAVFHNIDNDNARVGYEILEGPKNVLTVDYVNEVEKKMISHMSGVEKNDF